MFDQDEQDISQIIETGLHAILSGSATLEEVLARHPEHAEQIRPELEAAIWLHSRRQEVGPRAGFVSASRKRVLNRIKQESTNRGAKHAFMGIAWPQRLSLQWAAVAVLVVLLLSGTGGMVSFAQGALPGDNLYAVKRASETVAYTVSLSTTSKVHLSAEFATRRIDEVAALMKAGRYAEVKPTLQAFRQHVNDAVALLQEAGSQDDPGTLAMAVELKHEFSEQVDRLVLLKVDAPALVLGALDEAQGVLLAGIEITDDVAEQVTESTLTPTITLTSTVETPTPVITTTPSPFELLETQYPSLFEDDTLVPSPDGGVDPDDTSTSTSSDTSSSTDEQPKIWNTRRPADPGSPADENRNNEDNKDKKDK